MRRIATAVLALVLASCATAPLQPDAQALFNDHLFAPPSSDVSARDVFAMSDEMRHYIADQFGGRLLSQDMRNTANRQQALFDALYSKQKLKLEYDSTMTRNASQAFAARSGNCLSLVILTAALANQLGLTVQFQSVFSDRTMSRSNGIIYYSSHVNLMIGSKEAEGRIVYEASQPLIIDFLPPEERGSQRARVIREDTIVAMYLNNRAAESLGAGRLDDGYWWSRKAIEKDPTFLASYNTLGVIYRRHGNLKEAERIFNYVIALEPGNSAPISNLVLLLDDLGRNAESKVWAERLRRMQAYPPFYYFDLGLQAMKNKDFATARDMFAKEVGRAAYYHEFHAWLAAAYLQLGDAGQAQKHLAIAMQNSTTHADYELYAAKLVLIKGQLGPHEGATSKH